MICRRWYLLHSPTNALIHCKGCHVHSAQPAKHHIFQICVGSNLWHSLHAMWLNKAELRKMDGYQVKCLRIRPPYITRNSNATVLQSNCCKHVSPILKNLNDYHYLSPSHCYLTMMCVEDTFFNLVNLLWKACHFGCAGVVPAKLKNNGAPPKKAAWQ